jgi:hypothetical protein
VKAGAVKRDHQSQLVVDIFVVRLPVRPYWAAPQPDGVKTAFSPCAQARVDRAQRRTNEI